MVTWNGVLLLAMGSWFATGCAGQSGAGQPAAGATPAPGQAKVTGTVTILVGEELRFISSTAHPVITGGNPTTLEVLAAKPGQ